MKQNTPMDIKQLNKSRIYQYIRENGPVSRQNIQHDLGLSLPTITGNLQELEDAGLLDTSASIGKTGGRNATAYLADHNAGIAIGLHLTGHHVLGTCVNLAGEVLARKRIPLLFDIHSAEYRKTLAALSAELFHSLQLPEKVLLGTVVAVPSLLTEDNEQVIFGVSHDFTGTTRSEICSYFSHPTALIHDSDAAGYSEVRENKKLPNAVLINLNDTVGGSILLNNTVFSGLHHRAGEIGHMHLVPKGGKRCYCGRYGCFNTVCSSSIPESYAGGSLEHFFELLKNNDTGATELWEEYTDYLALAIHNLHMITDTSIVLGGVITNYITPYLPGLIQKINDLDLFEENAADYVSLCRYGTDYIAAGAALTMIDRFLENLFPSI